MIRNINTSIHGIVKLNEVSLPEGDSTICVFCIGPFLDELQGGTFPLATLAFETSSNGGASAIEFTNVVLSDALGNVLPVTNIKGAGVNVVPKPSTIFLLATGLIGLSGVRWHCS
ncbi:MAG: hypothetical protein ACPGYT_03050 [Nitrospirales bacterium]